jgi:prevent-host-death family protein
MWKLTEARSKFSRLFTRAMTEGPQRVRRRGETVVVVSEAEFERLSVGRPEVRKAQKMSLGEFLLSGPSFEGLDLERNKSPMRPVDLE